MVCRSIFLLFLILLSLASSDFEELSRLTGKNVAVLNDVLFENYIANKTRDFDMVLLFSYSEQDSRCSMCQKTISAFTHVSRVWNEMGVESPKLIFAMIKMDSNPHLATLFGITVFPSLLYLPEDHPISSFSVEERGKLILYKENSVLVDVNIRHFIESLTGVQIVEPQSSFLSILTVIFLCCLICLFGYIYLFNNPFFYQFLGGWERWYTLCKTLIVVIVCGVMYDLLRKAPLLAVTRKGVSLFSKRGATILEGVLYGVIVTVISNRFMTLLSLNTTPKEEEKDGLANDKEKTRVQKDKEEEEETVEDTIYFNVSIIFLCVFVLIGLFSCKNPWYLSRVSHLFV